MVRKILLVGCGGIGSRHLQSLKNLDKYEIAVVEPNKQSIKLAKKRLDEVDYDGMNPEIIWKDSINNLQYENDLVIVATTSFQRVSIINKLMEFGNKKFLIEKMVCQSNEEYEKLLSIIKQYNSKIWVNTNRRYFPAYQKLKKFFTNKPISMSIIAGNKGLGSNAIHFIDLFSWFLNKEKIFLNGDFILEKLFPNKRGKKFFEFAGTIMGSIDDSILSISFLPVENMPLTLEIVNERNHILIDETNEKIKNIRNPNETNLPFNYLHVSEITQKIVLEILKNDDCHLPLVNQLFYTHSELFRIFNSHIKKLRNEEPSLCPIT